MWLKHAVYHHFKIWEGARLVCSIGISGDDDANTMTNSHYHVFPSSIPAITVVSGGSNYTAAATTI